MMDSARFAADILRRPVALVESLERLAADVETWRGRWWLNAFEDMLLPHDLQSTADAVLFAAEAGSAIARRFLETSGLNLQAAAAAVRESRESELQGVPAGLKRCAGSLSAWLRFEAYREAGLELPPLPAINLDELFGDLSEPQKPAPAAEPADSDPWHVPAPQSSAEGASDTQPDSTPSASAAGAVAPQGASGVVEWSRYRAPAAWLKLIRELGDEAPFTGETKWKEERREFPDSFEGTSRRVRITRAKAEEWGLSLPEFGHGPK